MMQVLEFFIYYVKILKLFQFSMQDDFILYLITLLKDYMIRHLVNYYNQLKNFSFNFQF